MPPLVLVAILAAFWYDSPVNPGVLSHRAAQERVLELLEGVAVVAMVAVLLGQGIAWRFRRQGYATGALRRLFEWTSRGVDWLSLAIFVWIIHGIGWPAVVYWLVGSRDVILFDDVLLIAPYLLLQMSGWIGLYPAEHLLRASRADEGLGRHLWLRARQSLGLVLPVALFFALGQDLLRWRYPEASKSPWVLLVSMAGMGMITMIFAPALVRLAWPTRPLPPGPLRERLERLASRFHFRCNDILVWDTGHAVVNAGVTGASPWFRYVLLTDALVECLDDRQIEAVFGHEVGHIAHRHLFYYGLFFLGSLGVMALAGEAISTHLAAGSPWVPGGDSPLVRIIQGTAALLCVGAYFLIVFGFVSRQFERQADVFGSRAISCGRPLCPPHADLNAHSAAESETEALCPVGIRTFANALSNVAALNGLRQEARSWRHGSIKRRIHFLEGLEGKPEAERRFQFGVLRLRLAVILLLIAALVMALATEALKNFR